MDHKMDCLKLEEMFILLNEAMFGPCILQDLPSGRWIMSTMERSGKNFGTLLSLLVRRLNNVPMELTSLGSFNHPFAAYFSPMSTSKVMYFYLKHQCITLWKQLQSDVYIYSYIFLLTTSMYPVNAIFYLVSKWSCSQNHPETGQTLQAGRILHLSAQIEIAGNFSWICSLPFISLALIVIFLTLKSRGVSSLDIRLVRITVANALAGLPPVILSDHLHDLSIGVVRILALFVKLEISVNFLLGLRYPCYNLC